MNDIFEFYKKIIENEFNNYNLWSTVVITAINKEQKISYEKQIEFKLKNNKLPKQFQYLVISDPENCKIGSGGSTLNVIRQLYDIYNDDLYKKKILLIHAGGYSQRMPSCSVLGKIFYPISCSNDCINDMFDMKLAIYTPFAHKMSSGGIFLTSSDDIETFSLDEQLRISELFGSDTYDFILIAHKSTPEIGKDHGCYGVDKKIKNYNETKTDLYECKIVLQKPNYDKMKEYDLLMEDNCLYTDSVFYFNSNIIHQLLLYSRNFYEQILDFNIEIDAYRDFLQPLGTKNLSLIEYLKSAQVNVNEQSAKRRFLEALYKIISNKRSLILALDNSKFYHLGTINELFDLYLSSNDESKEFRKQICFSNTKNSNHTSNSVITIDRMLLLNTNFSENCTLYDNCILENCLFESKYKISIGSYCYLNNCYLLNDDEDVINELGSLSIPASTCMHTIIIKGLDNLTKYVTICFNRLDDLKKVYNDIDSFVFLGKCLGGLSNKEKIRVFKSVNSLWNLKIFKAESSLTKSFYNSIRFVHDYSINNKIEINYEDDHYYSLFEIISICDYDKMISICNRNSKNT